MPEAPQALGVKLEFIVLLFVQGHGPTELIICLLQLSSLLLLADSSINHMVQELHLQYRESWFSWQLRQSQHEGKHNLVL